MASVNVLKLLDGYASKKGISTREVAELTRKVVPVDAKELKELQKGAKLYADSFSDASRLEYERLVGVYRLKGGKAVEELTDFVDRWRIDRDPGFRAKWGVKDRFDPRAPTFVRDIPSSSVPASLRNKFIRFANARLHANGQIDRGEAVKLEGANRIYDLKGRKVGYALISSAWGFTSYYRNDGTPAGLSADPPTD